MGDNRYRSMRRHNKKSGSMIMLSVFMTSFLGVIGIVYLTSLLGLLQTEYTRLLEDDYSDITYMDEIERMLFSHESIVFRHMATDSEKEKEELQKQANEIEKEINTTLSYFGENMKGSKFESYYHVIYSGIGGYFNNIDIIFEFSNEGNIETAEYYMNSALLSNINTVNSSATKLKELTSQELVVKKNRISNTLRFTMKIVTAVLVVLFAFGVLSHILCGKLLNKIVDKDSLTGIPNADYFEEMMQKLYKKKKLPQYTGILMNIKDFNYANKRYGSLVCDNILVEYAKALKKMLSKDELISRQGGDTFMVLIKHDKAVAFLKEIKNISVHIDSNEKSEEYNVVSRCGAYEIQPRDTVSYVMNCVSMTLNDARRSTTSNQVWFSMKQYECKLEEKHMLEQFRQGIDNKEFVVYYQPKVDVRTNTLCGAEALVRWIKDGKMIPPDKFIPVLEKEGKVVELDYYVFERVCEDIARWDKEGRRPVRISSNFSKLHLHNKNFADDLLQIVNNYNISHECLEIELTESLGHKDFVMLKSLIERMRKENIYTSIDDFGTGYSSLSMLRDVEVDVVKLDKSFLEGVGQNDENKKRMILHLVRMIQDLNRHVICEGVETREEYEFLKSVSCDIIQGYLFDKPLPCEEFENRLDKPEYTI